MKKGFVAGSFDLIHPGYIDMFIECKKQCDFLIVGLHVDPSIERNEKLKPVIPLEDRIKILNSIKYVDDVVLYHTETDLVEVLKNVDINIRFLGNDYLNKPYTGNELEIPIHYLNRNHGWSTTKLKQKIINQNLKK